MNHKKLLCLLLAVALCVGLMACGSGGVPEETPSHAPAAPESSVTPEPTPTPTPEPVVIPLSDPADPAVWQAENTSDLMDLSFYVGEELSVSEAGQSGDAMVRSFTWGEEFYSVLEDYAALLCAEYGYEQVGETHYKDYGNVAFFDMVLRYTGNKSGLEQAIEGTFSENKGDVMIYGNREYGRIKGAVWYDDLLTAGDDGWRHGQAERVCTQAGESIGAGLEYYDGTFRTTDGRLSTTLNHANLLTDGKSSDYTARYEIDLNTGRFYVQVEDKYKNGRLQFYVPTLQEWEEGFYPASLFVKEADFSIQCKGVIDGLPSYRWNTMFTVEHGGTYVYPVQALTGEMTGFGFRVMYIDEQVAVFYTCSQFRSQPSQTEALIAVRIDVEPKDDEPEPSTDTEGSCGTCMGSGKCSFCGGSGTELNLFAGTSEWIPQDCRFCIGSGKCSTCNGSGKK